MITSNAFPACTSAGKHYIYLQALGWLGKMWVLWTSWRSLANLTRYAFFPGLWSPYSRLNLFSVSFPPPHITIIIYIFMMMIIINNVQRYSMSTFCMQYRCARRSLPIHGKTQIFAMPDETMQKKNKIERAYRISYRTIMAHECHDGIDKVHATADTVPFAVHRKLFADRWVIRRNALNFW